MKNIAFKINSTRQRPFNCLIVSLIFIGPWRYFR